MIALLLALAHPVDLNPLPCAILYDCPVKKVYAVCNENVISIPMKPSEYRHYCKDWK